MRYELDTVVDVDGTLRDPELVIRALRNFRGEHVRIVVATLEHPNPATEALSRARGLAAKVRQLEQSNHALHVALENERLNRIKGEGLRAKIRDLEARLAGQGP